MGAIVGVLAPAGLLAFTVETHVDDGIKLLPTLRYAHGAAYLHRVLADANLIPAHFAAASVRNEKGVPVDSLVIVVQPTAAPSATSKPRRPTTSGSVGT